jgi:hypothetical protein
MGVHVELGVRQIVIFGEMQRAAGALCIISHRRVQIVVRPLRGEVGRIQTAQRNPLDILGGMDTTVRSIITNSSPELMRSSCQSKIADRLARLGVALLKHLVNIRRAQH